MNKINCVKCNNELNDDVRQDTNFSDINKKVDILCWKCLKKQIKTNKK